KNSFAFSEDRFFMDDQLHAGDPQPLSSTAQLDTGLICLVMLARYHSVAAEPEQLAHEFQHDGQPFAAPDLLLASKKLGLSAKQVRTDSSRLPQTPLPAIAQALDGTFFVIARADAEKVLIHDPRVE